MRILSTLLATAAFMAAVASPAAGAVTLDGDFDPSLSPFFASSQNTSGSSVGLTTSPAFDGNAARLTVGNTSGTKRAQLDCSTCSHQDNGETIYTGWRTYVPTGYPSVNSWHVFMQWFAAPFAGSPPVAVGLSGNDVVVDLHTDGSNKQTVYRTPMPKGQ